MNAETSPTVGHSATIRRKIRIVLAIAGIGILIAIAAYWRMEAQLAAVEEIDIPDDCQTYTLSRNGAEHLVFSGRLADGFFLREMNRTREAT